MSITTRFELILAIYFILFFFFLSIVDINLTLVSGVRQSDSTTLVVMLCSPQPAGQFTFITNHLLPRGP